jgi:spermidine synthase
MAQPKNGGRRVAEPIYAIFTMLEAVRLVEPGPASTAPTALNIGLGVGTAPSAMIAHGINTTIVELDPVVHEFAVKYFSLPHNHSFVIGDAVSLVANSQKQTSEAESYDYIIHDVFTGGAEPVELFTTEFLSGLYYLLKQDGVIALNYAGDVAMPAASVIYRTISSVFPACKVFREDEPPAPGTKKDDFTNMVFFCRKTNSPISFRKPQEADFLGSGARKAYMVPKHEIPLAAFDHTVHVLQKGKTKQLEQWQTKSALGHWRLMRTVLPDAVWENW